MDRDGLYFRIASISGAANRNSNLDRHCPGYDFIWEHGPCYATSKKSTLPLGVVNLSPKEAMPKIFGRFKDMCEPFLTIPWSNQTASSLRDLRRRLIYTPMAPPANVVAVSMSVPGSGTAVVSPVISSPIW